MKLVSVETPEKSVCKMTFSATAEELEAASNAVYERTRANYTIKGFEKGEASITSIAVFVTPALYEPATLLRIGVVVAAGLAGPVGLAGAFFVLLLSLSGTGMLGVPYLAQHPFPQSPLAEDGIIRRNYRHLSRKGFNIWQKRRPRA